MTYEELLTETAARKREIIAELDAAAEAGLPILSFGGYGPCQECLNADGDTQTDDEDDICCVICHSPTCPEYMKKRTEESSL